MCVTQIVNLLCGVSLGKLHEQCDTFLTQSLHNHSRNNIFYSQLPSTRVTLSWVNTASSYNEYTLYEYLVLNNGVTKHSLFVSWETVSLAIRCLQTFVLLLAALHHRRVEMAMFALVLVFVGYKQDPVDRRPPREQLLQ